MTTTQTITVRDLLSAARAFSMEGLPDAAPASPDDIGLAGVVSVETRHSREYRELVDGLHRAAAIAAWAGDDDERLAAQVSVVVTDDAQLVRAILDRKDEGRDDVDDLIEAALA